MSRETVTTLRCDLCGATAKPVPQTEKSYVPPEGWGTGEWKRAKAGHYEHLILGLQACPDICPDCMRQVEAVLIKRRQANLP